MDNAMLERIQTDGNPPKATNASVTTRAELAVAPAPVQTEMRERPVVAPTQSHRSSDDEERVRAVIHVIGHVRNETDKIAAVEENERKLDEIHARLFRSGKVKSENSQIDDSAGAKKAADEVEKLLAKAFGSDLGESAAAADNAAEWALRSERELTENKIDLALRRVGLLRNKLSVEKESSYDELVNISSSVAGLNIARTQVDDSDFSIARASSAVDSVMTNLRSMVTAHGNVSPEVVRLILN
jgi:hypothetical protein